MAKRKRLTPARLDGVPASPGPGDDMPFPAVLETKSMFPHYPMGVAVPAPSRVQPRAPIAQVAGAQATAAAFDAVAQALADARAEGRLIQRLPLAAIDEAYLVRDRVLLDGEDMQVLCDSLRARGQQTAIEVVALGHDRWGLISGARRVRALKRLHAETNDAKFGTVLALSRQPAEAAEAYLAMVEENEIRVGLSYYERARIVARAVEKGVYGSDRQALAALFQAASRAKRSKIGSFLRIVRALDADLRFPTALTERSGLALAGALERDETLEQRLVGALQAACPESAESEAQVIRQAMMRGRAGAGSKPVPTAPAVALPAPLRTGLACISHADGRLTLQGPALADPEFRARLLAWLRENTSVQVQ